MSERGRVGDIVDGDELDLGISQRSTENIAPNSSKTVDAYFNFHEFFLLSSIARLDKKFR